MRDYKLSIDIKISLGHWVDLVILVIFTASGWIAMWLNDGTVDPIDAIVVFLLVLVLIGLTNTNVELTRV